MKLQTLIAGAVVLAFFACKPSYKATDRQRAATDTTAAVKDTTAAMNKMPTDSVNQPLPDTAMAPSRADSVPTQPMPDTSKAIPEFDSTRVPATDTAAMADTAATAMQAPAEVEAVFNQQYPGATNVVWSNYDSLAAVPIDLRLTGWKKMDAEDYMVKFDHDNDSYFAWYDNKGKWIGSASPMKDYTQMPAAVNKAVNNAIKTRYADYNITQVNREFQPGGKKAYEVELASGDNKVRMLVSSAGKINQIYRYRQTE